MSISEQIQKSRSKYKREEAREMKQKEKNGVYDAVIIESEINDYGHLNLEIQSEFGIHKVDFEICDSNRESGKSEPIEKLEDKTDGDVEFPESFIGKKVIIKNTYTNKNSIMIFESDLEEYIRKMWINTVNKSGNTKNEEMIEFHYVLSMIFTVIVSSITAYIMYKMSYSFNFQFLTIFGIVSVFSMYQVILTILHEYYNPVVQSVESVFSKL